MRIIEATNLEEDFFGYREVGEMVTVRTIIQEVRRGGDEAIKKFILDYDGVKLENIKVDVSEIKNACSKIDSQIFSSLQKAAENIKKFAGRQLEQFQDFEIEIAPGVFAGQKVIPIERVGIYVPGGRFPLASSLLMGAVPARVAGVKEIAVCSPPSRHGSIHPAILVAADMAGVEDIYKIGGVQAIAAFAYGSETINRVDKIIGPGNAYVTLAKKEVFGVVGIDFVAGPSELMIIADETARPEFVAADLLAQAEHDSHALPVLITNSTDIAERVKRAVEFQLRGLETKAIAEISIKQNGRIILVDDLDEAVSIANRRAPEHLELHIKNPENYIEKFRNYGSLFRGEHSAEVLGDYSSGLNHTLPTNTCARYTGGLSVKDFIKIQTTLEVRKEGFPAIASIAKTMAEVEGLDGHAKSVTVRICNE